MKNIILTMSMILIPFIALAGSIEEINRLMEKIKANSETYRILCYRNQHYRNIFGSGAYLDIDNREGYCAYLKTTIEHDINEVLEMEHGK